MSDIQVTSVNGQTINVSTGTVVGPLPELQIAAGTGISINSSGGVSTISANVDELSIPANLADLSDVSNVSPTVGQTLSWNGTAWVAANTTAGTVGNHTHNIADLGNVNTTGIADGQVLSYDNGTWVAEYSVSAVNLMAGDITVEGDGITVVNDNANSSVVLAIDWPSEPFAVSAIQNHDGTATVMWQEPIPRAEEYVVEWQELSALSAPNITEASV